MSKGEENDFSHLSKSLADLIVSDVFERNKVVVRKDIPEDQKQKIRKLAQDLQEQVDVFLQKEREENL